MSLHDKVAIVTGGNSGIGKAIALGLAKAGAAIVIDYIAHPEATEALERDIAALGDVAIGVEADVSNVQDLQTPGRRRGREIRPPRHHGEQRRYGNPHLRARHHGSAVRQGARPSTSRARSSARRSRRSR